MATKIAWANETWSPVIGCTKIAAGCKNCYAERMATRLATMPLQSYYRHVVQNGKWNGDVYCLENRLSKPLHWRKPRKIFVCSMSDLFHEQVPFEFIDRVFSTMARCPQHQFQILTKRFVRAVEYFEYAKLDPITDHITVLFSVATQEELWVAEGWLWQIPAAVRGFSLEPLLGPIQELPPFEWYIVGCESGPKRRHCEPEWVQDIVRQCREANVPVFVKQIDSCGTVLKLTDANKDQWPDWAVQEYPK